MKTLKYIIGYAFLIGICWFQISHAAITFIQATSTNCGSTTDCTLHFGSNTSGGDFYIVTVNGGGQSLTLSATSTQGDTFNLVLSQNQTTQGNSQQMFYAMNVAGGTTSINIHKSTPATIRASIAEYSGVATSNALDTATSSQGANSPSNSGNITPSHTGELLIGGTTNGNNGATTGLVAKNGFTLETYALCNTSQCEALEDLIATTTATVSSSFSWTSGTNWTQSIAAFLPASNISPMLSLSKATLTVAKGTIYLP